MAKQKSTAQEKRTPAADTGMLATPNRRNEPTHEQIARRAYELFEARGGTPGDPVSDWLHAENELRLGRQ